MGAQWRSGKHPFIATYSASRDGGDLGEVQPECDLAAVGYKYTASRRTFFIASYAKVENREGDLCNFGSDALSIEERQDPEGFSLGLRTVF